MITLGKMAGNLVEESYLVGEVPPHMEGWPVLPPEVGPNWRLVDGEWIAPEPKLEPVPEFVSRLQGRIALHRMGMLEAVEAMTQQAGGEIWIAWQDAGNFYRDSLLIAGLAPHFGWSEADIDAMFRLAATIKV